MRPAAVNFRGSTIFIRRSGKRQGNWQGVNSIGKLMKRMLKIHLGLTQSLFVIFLIFDILKEPQLSTRLMLTWESRRTNYLF